MERLIIILQVLLYHINCHKWKILTYGLMSLEIITFVIALLSDDVGAYAGLMAILALAGITAAVILDISSGK